MSELQRNDESDSPADRQLAADAMPEKPKRKRRLGIRHLLLFVTLCAAGFGVWNYKCIPLLRAAELLERESDSVEFCEAGEIEVNPLTGLEQFAYRVLGINVDFRNVRAIDVTDLESLAGLQQFENLQEFSSNGGEILDLSPLSELKSLRVIYICGFAGDIDLSPLNGLPNLEELYVESELLTELASLGDCPKLLDLEILAPDLENIQQLESAVSLVRLCISDSQVNDITCLRKLKNLKSLDLSCGSIENVSALSELSELENLDLNDTFVRDISAVSHMPLLKRLKISRTEVSDLAPLANLSELTHLELADCALAGIEPLAPLGGLGKLEEVDLSGCPVAEVAFLKSSGDALRILNLARTKIDDVEFFKRCPNLWKLNICDTKVTDLSPLLTENSATRNSWLNLKMAGVTLDRPETLKHIDYMITLNISRTNVTKPAYLPIDLKFLIAEDLDIDLERVKELLPACSINEGHGDGRWTR